MNAQRYGQYLNRMLLFGLSPLLILFLLSPLLMTSMISLAGIPFLSVDSSHNFSGFSGLGIVSVGGLAVGLIAIGGGAIGVLAIGGGAVGIIAIGGGAVGVIALGGAATGWIALGPSPFGWYVMGIRGRGRYTLNLKRQDSDAVRFFTRYLPGLSDILEEEPDEPNGDEPKHGYAR